MTYAKVNKHKSQKHCLIKGKSHSSENFCSPCFIPFWLYIVWQGCLIISDINISIVTCSVNKKIFFTVPYSASGTTYPTELQIPASHSTASNCV